VQRPLPRVTVGHPTARSLIDEDDYTGWLRASQEVEVRSRVRGHIQKIHFRDGEMVKQGQLLFELDPRPFQAALEQSLAQAKVADAQRLAAEKDLARDRELILQKAVSQAELEKAEANALSFAAQVAAATQQAEQSKLNLEYSRIAAPINGRISRARLTQGNLVDAGGTDPVLTTIVAIDPLYVYFSVDERALQRYQKSRQHEAGSESAASLRELKIPFRFGLDTDEGFPHAGVLDFAENKVASSTGTIELRGGAPNPDGQLIPGSRVRVRVPVSDPYEAVVVPDSAVLSDLDRKYMLILGKDNVVLRRDFTPGRLLDDGMRVILPASGEEKPKGKEEWIKGWEKEWVVTLGLQRARVDYPVEPLDSNGQPIGTKEAGQ
jgi:RND family efflux transporter MFP subunit